MSSNLPPGCTQGDIDRALGGAHPDWICEDAECRQGWAGEFEYWPCDIDGCSVIGCEECRAKCRGCDRNACSAHRAKYDDDGNDKLAFWCTECIAERKAQYPENHRRAS